MPWVNRSAYHGRDASIGGDQTDAGRKPVSDQSREGRGYRRVALLMLALFSTLPLLAYLTAPLHSPESTLLPAWAWKVQAAGVRESAPYVSYAEAERTWAIGNDSVERKIALTADNRLLLRSWVDKLSGREWADPDHPSDEFLISYARPGQPFQQLTGSSGLAYVSHAVTRTPRGAAQLELVLADAASDLELHLFYAAYPLTSTIETWARLTNRGGRGAVTVGQLSSFHLRVRPSEPSLTLNWVQKGILHERGWALNSEPLTAGAPRLVRSSTDTPGLADAAAWFALADSGQNAGVYGGWEWSGHFRVLFGDLIADGPGWVSGGIDPLTFQRTLQAGESLDAPKGFVGLYNGGLDEAGVATQTFANRYLAAPAPDDRLPLAHYNTWYSAWSHVNEADIKRQVDLAASLGFESFTIDHGWYAQAGDWRPDPQKFPNGLAAIADYAHSKGLKFGLWLAFGLAGRESEVARQHPDWLARANGEPRLSGFAQDYVLCLAKPEAQNWAKAELDRAVREYKLDWFEYDMELVNECDGRTDANYASTQAFYNILDDLRARHPSLIIENCSNGGFIVDFGILQRTHVFTLTDYSDPFHNLHAVHGATLPFPPRVAETYMSDLPFADGPLPPDSYLFRAAMMGQWTVGVNLSGPQWAGMPQRLESLRQAIATYKRVREVTRGAQVYHLLPQSDWRAAHALQFYSRQRDQAVVFLFGGDKPETRPLALHGLHPDQRYEVTFADSGDRGLRTGQELMTTGLTVGFRDAFGSAIVFIRPVPKG